MALGAQVGNHGDQVSYREIPCGKIIGRSKGAENGGYPFSHTINPYRGCEIGCTYCYARYTHGYLGMGVALGPYRPKWAKSALTSAVLASRMMVYFSKNAAVNSVTTGSISSR